MNYFRSFISSFVAFISLPMLWPLCSPKTAQCGQIGVPPQLRHTISLFLLCYLHVPCKSVYSFRSMFLYLWSFTKSAIVIFLGNSSATFFLMTVSEAHSGQANVSLLRFC